MDRKLRLIHYLIQMDLFKKNESHFTEYPKPAADKETLFFL